jgi:hypothetical protein
VECVEVGRFFEFNVREDILEANLRTYEPPHSGL